MKKIISTTDAPAAVGPYSQAVRVGSTIYCPGQIPLDPATNQMIEGDITAQTERVMENLKGLLEACESSLAQVVKTTVFLADMNDFAAMNEVYARYFVTHPPARSTVEVSKLPRNVRVEIDLIALL